tara:strand:- start:8251 stop:9981 length:1731 start_codon:yes stop_codon:yes gene_type:complete
MKNILFKYVAIISICLFVACDDSFLEEKIFTGVSESNLYSTLETAQPGLYGLYKLMASPIPGEGKGESGTWFRGMEWMTESNTDELIVGGACESPAWITLSVMELTSDNDQTTATWSALYQGIAAANLFIENVGDIEATDAETTAKKKSMLAEATFMRGFFHYNLMMLFGGVPYLTNIQLPTEIRRNTIEEVVQGIENDWNFALANLEVDKNESSFRVGKHIVRVFQAKLNLYLGSANESYADSDFDWSQNGNVNLNAFDWVDGSDDIAKNNGKTRFQLAVELAEQVYGAYTLTPKYDRMFMSAGVAEQEKEFIFAVSFSPDEYNRSVEWMLPTGNFEVGGGLYGRAVPYGETFYLYAAEDIRIKNVSKGLLNDGDFETIEGLEFQKLDLIDPDFEWGWNKTEHWKYTVSKWRRPVPGQVDIDKFTVDWDMPLMRYGELLLLLAEADFRATGSETRARQLLSELRLRAAEDDTARRDALDAEYLEVNLIDEIMEERSRELCFEMHRRYDLIRTGRYLNSVTSKDPLLVSDAYQYRANIERVQNSLTTKGNTTFWYPIPLRERLIFPSLEQNPGYNN